MIRLTIYTVILFVICAMQAEHVVAEQKKEFTDEQLDRLKAAEEQYKDNPALMKIITRLKENYGISDEPPAPETPPPAPPEPAFEGSRSEAEIAYRNKDYKTAMDHYQALAKAGDGDAGLILGTMYEQGLGTDPDPATAQAWFRKAAEDGNPQGQEIMELYRLKPMPPDEQELADQRYDEINKEQNDKDSAGDQPGPGKSVTGSGNYAPYPYAIATTAAQKTDVNSLTKFVMEKSAASSLTVEQLKPMPHFKTTTITDTGWQPAKLQNTHSGEQPKH